MWLGDVYHGKYLCRVRLARDPKLREHLVFEVTWRGGGHAQGRTREIVHDQAHGLATDMKSTAFVAEDPSPPTRPREFDERAVGILGKGDDTRAGAGDGGYGVVYVGVESEWGCEEMGVVRNGEVWTEGEIDEGCDGDGGVAGCCVRVDARDAEPGSGERVWCDGEGNGLCRRRGDAGLECVGNGCADGLLKVCGRHVGKVGWATECATDDVAIVVGDDGRSL